MASPGVHPTAVVSARAELAESVKVGPYTIIGDGVQIGADTEIGAHSVLEGPAKIGASNKIYPFATLGTAPQDLKYQGTPTLLVVGDHNIFREYVTINRGTEHGGGVTRIGNHSYFMAYCHVAHDCTIGNHSILANCATLAGHVLIEDHVVFGGLAAVHQFSRIGNGALVAAGAMVSMDVAPYCIAAGDRASMRGLNLVGLKRRGFSTKLIKDLKAAYHIVYQENLLLEEALVKVEDRVSPSTELAHFLSFLRNSSRGITR